MNTQAFIEKLMDRAKQAGFDQAEIYLSEGDSFEATVHEGQINTYDVSSSMGLGFRGAYQGKMGYAFTQVLDGDAADQLIGGARTNAQLLGDEDPESLFEGAAQYPHVEGLNPALETVPAAKKLEKVLALESAALKIDEKVKQLSDCGLFTLRGRVRIANTLGLDVCHEDNGCGMYLSAVARAGEEASSATKLAFGNDFDKLDVAALARQGVAEAIMGLGGAPVSSGGYQVALRNDVAASLLRTFAGVFSADAAQKGLSLLSGREGELIGATCLSLMDDPLRGGGFASMPFDGEGVACYTKPVIEAGRLNTLLHNRKTAFKQGVTTTGNAARGASSGSVSVSPTNFYFAPGALSRDALLHQMGTGLLITEVQGLHAGANPVTGDFSLGAKGFLVEGGALGAPVSGITVAGNFFDLMKNVCLVADDLYFGAPGSSCVGSPTLWAGQLQVAGK